MSGGFRLIVTKTIRERKSSLPAKTQTLNIVQLLFMFSFVLCGHSQESHISCVHIILFLG